MSHVSFELEPYLARQQRRVEALLSSRLSEMKAETPPKLYESMAYSLSAGGKRLRPVLCLSFSEVVRQQSSIEHRPTEDAACSLEYVHTYSLVHDDLPAMDDLYGSC